MIEWNGEQILGRIEDATMEGLVLAGEFLLQESRTRVPIDEGTLERSGTVTQDTEKMQVAVAYDTPYAERVHEDLIARHAPGRSAKYLEDPANEHAATMLAIIATQARRTTGGT